MADRIQAFLSQNKKRFLVVNIAPRHGKSYTGTNLTSWILGKDPKLKVMTASYNETLSTIFARQVRNTIDTLKVDSNLVYNDIFPDTKIKRGEASASLWTLVGSDQKNYLATSPGGTATGMGANLIIVDDVIKNSMEAYNQRVLDDHWEWFNNTMIQRLEGQWHVIIIMTRWSKRDLAGRVIDEYGDEVELISYTAVQPDGSMLCDEILSKEDYELKIRNMNKDIVEANYNQKPIDMGDLMFPKPFNTYDKLPEGTFIKYSHTDTADTGSDNLCTINYIVHDMKAYVTDIVYTDAPMEETEEMVADLLYRDQVNQAVIESNNGGRGFARSIKRILAQSYKSNKTIIRSVPQTKNKEARILTASGWVNENIIFPEKWDRDYPEFYNEVVLFKRKGKNTHDDGVDVLSSIYEHVTGQGEVKVINRRDYGL